MYLLGNELITIKAGESCVAVYFDDNPEQLSEEFRAVTDENGDNLQFAVIHALIPTASFDPEKDYGFGPMSQKGHSVYTDLYNLGRKRLGSLEKTHIEEDIVTLYEKDNYIANLIAEGSDLVNPLDIKELNEMIDEIRATPEDKHREIVREDMLHTKSFLMKETPESEARQKFGQIWMLNNAEEMELKKDSIQKDQKIQDLTNKINFKP